MKIYAIFLSYYEKYQATGIEKFTQLLNTLDYPSSLIVVSNGAEFKLNNINSIPGNNTNWEFSGWDKGLEKISNFNDDDIFIFCNDTFCFHREWGAREQNRFSKAFLKLLDSNAQGICGEVNSVNQNFQIFGHNTDHWVSTYLFALTGGILRKNNYRLSIPEKTLEMALVTADEHRVTWGCGVSPNLTMHIQNWLYPAKIDSGWYNAQAAAPALKLRKAKTILNEKYLSALCKSTGGIFISANPHFMLRAYMHLKKLLNRLERTPGKAN